MSSLQTSFSNFWRTRWQAPFYDWFQLREANPIAAVKSLIKHYVILTSCDTCARVQWLPNDVLTRSFMILAIRGSVNWILFNFLSATFTTTILVFIEKMLSYISHFSLTVYVPTNIINKIFCASSKLYLNSHLIVSSILVRYSPINMFLSCTYGEAYIYNPLFHSIKMLIYTGRNSKYSLQTIKHRLT